MKKVLSLLSVFILLFVLNVNSVKADVNINVRSMPEEAGLFGGLDNFRFKVYFSNSNNAVDAYCHNPGVIAYSDKDIKNGPFTLNVKRRLGDPQNGVAQNIFDAGLMSIINNNGYGYMAKYVAINLYEQLFPMFNTNANNTSSEISYIKYIINEDLYDDIKGDLNKLGKKMGSYNVISGKMSGAENCDDNKCGSQNDIDSAISLVKTAIKKAVDYADNGEASATIGSGVQKRIVNEDNNVQTYTTSVTHNITIARFGDKNDNVTGSVYLNFTCNSSNCRNVTTKFYIEDQEITNLSEVNLLNYTENGFGIVKLRIEFTGNTCDQNKIDYTLSTTYNHYSVTTSGYSVAKCSNSNKCQGFYVPEASNSSGTKTVSVDNSISLCPTSGNGLSCTAKINNVNCVTCEPNAHDVNIVEGYTYANNNVCDTTGATLDIKNCIANDDAQDTAGHTYKNKDLSTYTSKINGAGVFCKEDYNLKMPGSIVTQNGGFFTLTSSIKGKETCYTSDLQGSKTVKQVKEDINTRAKATVEAYNEIQKYKAIESCLNDPNRKCYTLHTEKILSKTVEYQGNCYVYATEDEQLDNICGEDRTKCKSDPDGKLYKSCTKYMNFYDIRPYITLDNGSYVGISDSSTCKTGQAIKLNTSVEGEGLFYGEPLGRDLNATVANSLIDYCTDDTHCNAKVDDITDAEKEQAIAAIGQQAHGEWVSGGTGCGAKVECGGTWKGTGASGLTASIGFGSIASLINDWNSATGYYDPNMNASGDGNVDGTGSGTSSSISGNDFSDQGLFKNGWLMSYNFNPEMNFWYQEEYMKDTKTSQMDMYDKTINNVKAQYCDGDVSSDYETCTTGWKDVPTLESGSVCVCWGHNEGDCGIKTYDLSKVRYVRQWQNAEAKFITPTQFYTIHPTGSIVVSDPGKSDTIANATELTNGLPVALKTNATRRYVMWVEKLGEYFDKDSLGRVWGESDSVMASLLQARTNCNIEDSALVYEDNTQGIVHGDGVYACKYSTDCPEDNKCQTPEESTDGNYHCIEGDICDEEQYKKQCLDLCKTPSESSDGNYHCPNGEVCDEERYNKECNNTCKKPSESDDNKYHCLNGEVCDETQYKNECQEVCKKPSESKDGKYHCIDGRICDKTDYNRECCPSCPPTVSYKCAVTMDEEGNTLYYDQNGVKTDEATYKSQCCPNGECPVTCSFCLYDGNKLNVQYRPITSEDINPNDRELGTNWRWDEPIDTALELKAYVTTDEIEEKGDEIFEISDDEFNNPNENNEYAVKITMNGKMISRIRAYNRDHKDEGYAGNTLDCYDLVDGDNVYENVFCYSRFIDYIEQELPNNIKFTRVRPKNNERNNTSSNEKYFTSWLSANSNKWNVSTTRDIAYYKEHYGMEVNSSTGKVVDYHIGPSWK